MAQSISNKPAGVSDAAVKNATNKTWTQWLKILDAAGARKMTHKEIAALLNKKYPAIGGWWAQMVTVGYEQARGMRRPNQKLDGFAMSCSRTIAAPVDELYAAWKDKRRRRQWLPEAGFTVRTATPNKSMRITWIDGKSSVHAYFYGKGAGKSQISVQHEKLSGSAAVARMKKLWAERLNALRTHLQA